MQNNNSNFITLQQFLKKKNIVMSGGEGKQMIQEGKVLVNGEVEVRRGKKLYAGDSVEVDNRKYTVD